MSYALPPFVDNQNKFCRRRFSSNGSQRWYADFEPHVQISVQASGSLSATWSIDEIHREPRIVLDRIDLCKWWLCQIDDSEQFMSVSTVFRNGCHWYRHDAFERTNPCYLDNYQGCFRSFLISLWSASCCGSRQSWDRSSRIELSLPSRSLSVKIREQHRQHTRAAGRLEQDLSMESKSEWISCPSSPDVMNLCKFIPMPSFDNDWPTQVIKYGYKEYGPYTAVYSRNTASRRP